MNAKKTKNPRLLRMFEILGDARRGIQPMIPVSRSTWLAGVKSGKYPPAFRIAPRTIVWRYDDVVDLIEKMTSEEAA